MLAEACLILLPMERWLPEGTWEEIYASAPKATAFSLCAGLLLNQIVLQPNESGNQVFCIQGQALCRMGTYIQVATWP